MSKEMQYWLNGRLVSRWEWIAAWMNSPLGRFSK